MTYTIGQGMIGRFCLDKGIFDIMPNKGIKFPVDGGNAIQTGLGNFDGV
jgi:hypothetical protein